MVHNNKVLTVSYGTFSCTLEGFDDSFGTMKAIAEYFRDLASDDRYFGAEPPQPDADMLARIAQREIARQVEAHSTDAGRIVLRAADVAPAPAEAEVIEPAPEPTPEAVAPEAVAEPAQEPTMEPELVHVETREAPAPEVDVQEAATIEEAPAATIPAEPVVAEPIAPAAPAAVEPAPVEEPAAEPEPVAHIVEVVVTVEDVAEAEAPAPFVAENAVLPEPVAETEAEVKPTPVDIIPEPETKPETVPAADSIAAKLQRIRAVVSQNDTLVQMDDYTEDQHADGFVAASDQDDSQSQDGDDDIQASQAPDTEILQVLNQLDTPDEDYDEDFGDNIAVPVDHGFGDGIDDGIVEAGDVEDDALFDNTDADTQPEDDIEDDTADSGATENDIFADEPLTEDGALFDAPDADEQEQAEVAEATADSDAAQARVVKVKRADLETAIVSGQLEQIVSTDEVEQSTLSAEEEADLMRELAEVEAEMVEVPDSADAEDNIFGEDIASEVAEYPDQDAATPPALAQTVSEDEADLSRLMAEADQKLDDPATSTNRETYSQLRAAVAATEADHSAGGAIADHSQADAYRDDLADVVRPRRPALEAHRMDRPAVQSRPAPLKLVAEQRVDEGAGLAQRGPVRPRRVMTVPAPDSIVSEATAADSAFAEFADRMGATELPDLLEAAAAYLSFVEGHDKFSRPQLMNKVRLIQQDDYNREDGLRSFGQLLRDGKIEKRGGGRFAASSEIGFRPDDNEREAG